jgi:hypothetical protein
VRSFLRASDPHSTKDCPDWADGKQVIHDNKAQFRRHFTYMIEAYGGLKREDVPAWAWKPFDRLDNDTFSPEMLIDLPIEGCVIFRKKDAR